MILRSTSGWQTIFADLSLILFLVTAQAVANQEDPLKASEDPEETAAQGTEVTDISSALAVHRPRAGEDVREWLATTITDGRQMATITINYDRSNRARSLAEGERLLTEAEAAGVPARLIASPSENNSTLITVDFLIADENGTVLAE